MKTIKVNNKKQDSCIKRSFQCPICGIWIEYGWFPGNRRYARSNVDERCCHAPDYVSIKQAESGIIEFRLEFSVDEFDCPICHKICKAICDTSGDDPRLYDDTSVCSHKETIETITGVKNDVCKHFHPAGYGEYGVIFQQTFTKEKPIDKKGKK